MCDGNKYANGRFGLQRGHTIRPCITTKASTCEYVLVPFGVITKFPVRFGGHDEGLIPSFNDLWEFNTRTQTWSQVQCEGLLPDERDAHCATVIGDNMFIFSGFRKPDEWDRERELSGTFINDAFVFNFAGTPFR